MCQKRKYGKFTQAYQELAVCRIRESENMSELTPGDRDSARQLLQRRQDRPVWNAE